MSFLTALRQSRLRVLLTALSEGERDHEEISGLDAQIRTDYHGRFLIELIQNAVDPALKAGIDGARMLIVRTPELLAVLNQGAPFDEAGLRSIVSLGISSKKPDEAIGNKGVGFKSVFEVAHAAEIFGGTSLGDDLLTPGLRMRLTLAPALGQEGLAAAAHTLLEGDPVCAGRIRARHGDVSVAINAALGKIPGWRYPQELTAEAWSARAAELALEPTDLSQFHTAVVLHLRPEAQPRIDGAIRELVGGTREVHLFLPGLGTIEVSDATGRTLLEREDVLVDRTRGIAVRRLRSLAPDSAPETRLFWVASTTVAGPELEASARTLPGQGWAEVKRAEVQVALPVPEGRGALPPDGRYFIGLPSKDATGSPFRVDARFHATLSRTALDRVDNPYNALLDRTAAQLAATLIRALRDAADDDPLLVDRDVARRAVTLALARGTTGGLADAVRRHLQGEPIVLRDDGLLTTVSAARRVDEADVEVVDLLTERPGPSALHDVGIHLADRCFDDSFLEDVGVRVLRPEELLARVSDSSVLERLAAALPRGEDAKWRALLCWCAERLPAAGADQRLLPTVGGLVPPSSRPFVPLLVTPASGELSASDVPAHLLDDLVFLDNHVIGVDPELRRSLIEGERPLARRPSAFDVLAGAILPALTSTSAASDDARSREHLALGLRLLRHVGSADGVEALEWIVPCDGGWKPARDAYLGDAWLPKAEDKEDSEPTEGLVQRVYGPEGRCLIGWWGDEDERATMRAALLRVGVADEPRVLVCEPVERAIWGDYHTAHLMGVGAPAPIPPALWSAWLLEVVAAQSSVDWGPRTWWRLDGVRWIDGLERPEAAPLLAEWALRQKEVEHAQLVPVPERPNRWRTGARVAQPWMFALRRLEVPFVPTHPKCVHGGQPVMPAEVCRVPSERNIVPWLPRVAEKLNLALLTYVGVRALSEMPVAWLIEQLSGFAGVLEPARQNGILARGLWSLVNTRARTEALPELGDRTLPVWKDGEVVAVPVGALGSVTVIDDAYTAELLGDALDGAFVLEPEDEDWRPLADRLGASLPHVEVRLVTQLPIQWEADPAAETIPLLPFLARSAGHRAVRVLAALVRATRTGIGEKDMHRAWDALRGARVQAILGPSDPRAVWLPQLRILLTQDLEPGSLVAEVWPALGPAWRDDLLALGEAVRRGDRGLRDYIRHKRLRDEAMEDAAARCGLEDLVGPSCAEVEAMPLRQPTDASSAGTNVVNGCDDEEEEVWPDDLSQVRRTVEAATLPEGLPVEAPRPPETRPPVRPSGAGELREPRRGAHSRHRSDAAAREIGHLGELFAFRVLSALLPGFDESCWVSSSRALRDLDAGDDTLGYDFRYTDRDGVLTGRPGVDCLIEVKSNGGEGRGRFSLSANEWRLAQACNGSADKAFVIVRVHRIATDPQLGAVLVDPVALEREGAIKLSPKDGWWVKA